MKHIATFNKFGDFGLYPECFDNSKYKRTFSDYNKNDKKVNLSKIEFNNLVKQPCYICGKKYKEGIHSNGLDRVINTERIYTLQSCKPCCKTCNIMKHIFDYDEVIEKCKKVAYNCVISNTTLI
jgi:hypothetical protein